MESAFSIQVCGSKYSIATRDATLINCNGCCSNSGISNNNSKMYSKFHKNKAVPIHAMYSLRGGDDILVTSKYVQRSRGQCHA